MPFDSEVANQFTQSVISAHQQGMASVSYTHLTLPTNREV